MSSFPAAASIVNVTLQSAGSEVPLSMSFHISTVVEFSPKEMLWSGQQLFCLAASAPPTPTPTTTS